MGRIVSNPGRNVWDVPLCVGEAGGERFQIPEGTFGTLDARDGVAADEVVSNPGRNVWDPPRPHCTDTPVVCFKSRKERLGQEELVPSADEELRFKSRKERLGPPG